METELAIIDAQNAVQIFTGGGLTALLDSIEAKVRTIPFDPSTASGRDEIPSVAYRVARTKTALDAEGKRLTEGWREATKKVNDERKVAIERLDALAEEVRKPLTDFENKEKSRVSAHESALKDIANFHAGVIANQQMSAELLCFNREDLEILHVDRNWEEFSDRAQSARDEARTYIGGRIESRIKLDNEQAELSRLRKEEAERLQRERDERLQAEAAEKQRMESERKAEEEADKERQRVHAEAKRVRDENERIRLATEAKAKAEEDRLKTEKRAIEEKRQAEETARIAADKRAEGAKMALVAAEKKAAEDLKAAKEKARKDTEEAARKERERIESERKSKDAAEEKRAADQANRDRIHREIANDCAEKSANEIATAILEGRVRNVKVLF